MFSFCFCQQQLITDAELNGADIYIPVSLDVNLLNDLNIFPDKVSSNFITLLTVRAQSLNLTCHQVFLVRLVAGFVKGVTRNYLV